MEETPTLRIAVLISANTEWQITRAMFPTIEPHSSPLGEWFPLDLDTMEGQETVLFFHGGWGKIAAAASTQYVIDRWSPSLIVNLGTCGGFDGEIEQGTIILANRTIVYDIIEQMGDSSTAIARYTTDLDLSWLNSPYPHPVQTTLLVSADRDLIMEEIPHLQATYQAIAGDWESGAIAYVASRNNVRCLILRGVSDIVSGTHGEAYDNFAIFVKRATPIMQQLITALPMWIVCIQWL